MEWMKFKYLSDFETKIETILGRLSEEQMGLFGQTTLNK
jgi:hypothetical protein